MLRIWLVHLDQLSIAGESYARFEFASMPNHCRVQLRIFRCLVVKPLYMASSMIFACVPEELREKRQETPVASVFVPKSNLLEPVAVYFVTDTFLHCRQPTISEDNSPGVMFRLHIDPVRQME